MPARRSSDRVLDDLDVWLELFEERPRSVAPPCSGQGWPRDLRAGGRHRPEARRQKVIKSKSMLSEEAQLNVALGRPASSRWKPISADTSCNSRQRAPVAHPGAGRPQEPRRGRRPFADKHGKPRKTEIPALTRETHGRSCASTSLSADMGISGGNFLIAESRLGRARDQRGQWPHGDDAAKVHAVITGIEKMCPTSEDFATLMRLLPLPRPGRKSPITCRSVPARGPGDSDGPDHAYFVLVDNGRAGLVGSEFQPMLRCIRCGACMNHCPVYQSIGGHAYGWVYPGPMGSVLTSLYTGLENALDLPLAATLCNQCGVVCPVRIPAARTPARCAGRPSVACGHGRSASR